MRNSIFKGYAKKILKSEAFISVMIVFVLAIGIIGTSYAIYMDVDTDTNYQLVKVGDLSIGFDNGDNTITLENMTPMEDEYATNNNKDDGEPSIFSFYIYNTGSLTTDYSISLTTTSDNEVDAKYINYQLCKYNGNNCSDVYTLGNKSDAIDYEDKNGIIKATIQNDELAPKKENEPTNPSAYYFLKIWINKNYVNTTGKGQKIVLKVVVDAKNASGYLDNKNTLAGKILNNTVVNNTIPNLSDNEKEDVGLYKTEDNSGVSYYFRGQSSNNYVNFSGKCWRIVNIGGNGSIKLMLESNSTCSKEMSNDVIENVNVNNMIDTLNAWYENNITEKDKVESSSWCNDTSLYDKLDGALLTEEQIVDRQSKKATLYYGNSVRLKSLKLSLKCNDTINSNIYTLSIDDVILSGINGKESNKNTYITSTLNSDIALMSLKEMNYINNEYIISNYVINSDGSIGEINNTQVSNIKPVIVLTGNILADGNGTLDNPYTVK